MLTWQFERVKGRLPQLTESDILECARKTGTLEDRRTIALKLADPLLAQYGEVFTEVAASRDVVVDRIVQVDKVPRIALAVLLTTDKISEIDSARRVSTIREALGSTWPEAVLVVISVGYSSDEIASLLGETSSVIHFEEATFPQLLQAEVLKNVSAGAKRETLPTDQQELAKILATMQDRLDTLQSAASKRRSQHNRNSRRRRPRQPSLDASSGR